MIGIEQIFDRIRKKWVDNTPEETIRQQLIIHMIEKLHYPQQLIAVERELAGLAAHFRTPHQVIREIPKRRVDIVVFSQKQLIPLLIIECKSVPLIPKCARQVIGYNAFIGAPFVALANGKQVMTGSYDQELGAYRFEKGLPCLF